MQGPTSHSYFSQRLRLHYVDWGNPEAPPMILVHGGRDHCRNWDWVADRFRDDYHIVAPDLRGHGDSQWVMGGAYNQGDYVYDIARLLHQKHMTPVTVVGHSLGSAISLQYTALYPENVNKLVCIEGLGAPPAKARERDRRPLEQKLHRLFDELHKLSGRIPRRYSSLEDAFQRMQEENPHLSEEQARHLTTHGANQNEDGTYSWKFDNYVRVFSPIGVPYEGGWAMMGRITCPTLLIRGLESWATDPAEDGRLDYFDCNVETEAFADAGHWVHHDQLDRFVDRVKRFLAD